MAIRSLAAISGRCRPRNSRSTSPTRGPRPCRSRSRGTRTSQVSTRSIWRVCSPKAWVDLGQKQVSELVPIHRWIKVLNWTRSRQDLTRAAAVAHAPALAHHGIGGAVYGSRLTGAAHRHSSGLLLAAQARSLRVAQGTLPCCLLRYLRLMRHICLIHSDGRSHACCQAARARRYGDSIEP
jgi:hypothetical protein